MILLYLGLISVFVGVGAGCLIGAAVERRSWAKLAHQGRPMLHGGRFYYIVQHEEYVMAQKRILCLHALMSGDEVPIHLFREAGVDVSALASDDEGMVN